MSRCIEVREVLKIYIKSFKVQKIKFLLRDLQTSLKTFNKNYKKLFSCKANIKKFTKKYSNDI